MKYILLTIFLTSLNAYSVCTFEDLLEFGLKDLKNLTPKNCVKRPLKEKKFIKTKDGVCKCAQENLVRLDFIPDPFNQIKQVYKSINKSKIGLISLAEEIFLLNNNSKLRGIELSPKKCNSKQRFKLISKCNSITNTVLSQNERNKFAETLTRDLKRDALHRVSPPKNPEDGKNSLFNRYKFNSLNSCTAKSPISEKLVSDIQEEMLKNQILIIKDLTLDNPHLINSGMNINELLEKIQYKNTKQGDNKETETHINSMKELKIQLKSNPLFNHIAKSPDFLTSLINKNLNSKTTASFIDDYATNNKKSIKEEIEKKCDSVFGAFKAALCATTDETFIPTNSPLNTKKFLENEYDTSRVADLMQISSVLDSAYCKIPEDKKSNFEEVSELIGPAISDRLKREDNFDDASQDLYHESTQKMSEKICEYLPPGMDKLDKKYEELGCNKDNSLQSSECSLFEATKVVMQGTFETKHEQVEALALKKAKDRGITDKDQIKKLVKTMKDNIDTDAILTAYSDYNKVPEDEAKILNSFLGIEPEKLGNQNLEKNVASNAASDTSSAGSSNDGGGNITGGSLGSSAAIINPEEAQKNMFAKRAQERTDDNLDEFYKNVIKRSNVYRKENPVPVGTTQSASNEVKISEPLRNALKSPYPPSTRPSSSDGDSIAEYDTTQNFYESESNFFGGQPSTPEPEISYNRAPEPTQQQKLDREVNQALGEANAAKKAEKRRIANIGKVGQSPFKGKGSSSSRASANTPSNQSFPIDPTSVQGDLESLIDNVIAEKESGINGENIEHARIILKMLDKNNSKAVTLKSVKNPKFIAHVIKGKNGLRLVPLGDMTDGSEYKAFFDSINDFVIAYGTNSYQEGFSSLLKKLHTAVNKGIKIKDPEPGAVRYNEITNFR